MRRKFQYHDSIVEILHLQLQLQTARQTGSLLGTSPECY